MTLHRRRFTGIATAGLLATSLVAVTPQPASASPATLRSAFFNLFNAPLDFALSPVMGMYVVVTNMRDIDDPALIRIVFAVPGYGWMTGLHWGSSTIRGITGALELVPGVIVFPFKADLDPLMAPVERTTAMIEIENPLAENENPWIKYNPIVTPFSINLKFGLNYASAD